MLSPQLIASTIIAIVAGFILGRGLHRRGITAANALVGRQRAAYLMLAVLGALAAALFVPAIADRAPLVLMLGLQHYLWPGLGVVAAASAGLLFGLEAPGWRDPQRLRGMLSGGIGLLAAAGLLLSRHVPVAPRLIERVEGGNVLQSSPSSCAAASMATLARRSGLDPAMTERRMAERGGTTLLGTSTLGELRALRSLGADVRFARRLTADSLRARRQLALLHVDEPVAGRTIRHTIALVGYDASREEFIVVNPLYGEQRRSATALAGYWIGEAVFLTEHRLPDAD